MRLIIMAGLVSLAVPATCAAEDSHSHAGMSDGSRKIHELMEKSSKEMPKMEMSGDVIRTSRRSWPSTTAPGSTWPRSSCGTGRTPN
jgi:hypothetical protein